MLHSRCAAPLRQAENTAGLEKLMTTLLPFLLGGFFLYTGRKPASKSEKIKSENLDGGCEQQCRGRKIRDSKAVFRYIFGFQIRSAYL